MAIYMKRCGLWARGQVPVGFRGGALVGIRAKSRKTRAWGTAPRTEQVCLSDSQRYP